ncbi:hypothetical protein AAVH_09755 [Aphelenchoides avenae]|nr:hypothetical protein AAVH_09755 [Aphelenchus avenae]
MEPSPVSLQVDGSFLAKNSNIPGQQSPTFSSASTAVAYSPDSVSPHLSPPPTDDEQADNELLKCRLEELGEELEEKQKELKAVKEREHQTVVTTMATIKWYKEQNQLPKEDVQRANEKTDALQKALMNADAMMKQLRKRNEEVSNSHQRVAVVERDHSYAKVLEDASETSVQPATSRKRTASKYAASPAANRAAITLPDATRDAYQPDYTEPYQSVTYDSLWQPMTFHYY